jgi:hypothetical protein
MCCGQFGGPPYGIPIERETHRKYSLKLKFAWWYFNSWWKMAKRKAGHNLVDRKSMPKLARWALELIKKTPIPGFKNATGADSCYIIGIESLMTDSK